MPSLTPLRPRTTRRQGRWQALVVARKLARASVAHAQTISKADAHLRSNNVRHRRRPTETRSNASPLHREGAAPDQSCAPTAKRVSSQSRAPVPVLARSGTDANAAGSPRDATLHRHKCTPASRHGASELARSRASARPRPALMLICAVGPCQALQGEWSLLWFRGRVPRNLVVIERQWRRSATRRAAAGPSAKRLTGAVLALLVGQSARVPMMLISVHDPGG
jgi:hypothetical protein